MSKQDIAAAAAVREKIRQAISHWLGEGRLIRYLEKIVDGAIETKQFSAAVSALTTALRFGPGEVSTQEIQHSGHVIDEKRVLILPQTVTLDEWQKKQTQYESLKTDN